jgi:hypothetical protein
MPKFTKFTFIRELPRFPYREIFYCFFVAFSIIWIFTSAFFAWTLIRISLRYC